jgi:SAM-dependent methyltransferase
MAQRLAPVHDQLVERLAPRADEHWLDLATGTGGVAVRAAAAGADVTGSDIAPAMIEAARARAPQVCFDVADCEALPYADASFDVVSSSFGFIFAPDHSATAAELARVCAGRLGFTAWEPDAEVGKLYRAFDLDPPEGRLPFEWGKREHVAELLGEMFVLEVESHTWLLEGADGEEIWELWRRGAPPFKAMVEGLDAERRKRFHDAYVEYCERYRDGDRVRVPRRYLLALGARR